MKQLFTLLACLVITVSAHAQQPGDMGASTKKEKHNKRDKSLPPACYIGFSLGINNPSGIIGLDVNIPLTKTVSLDGGAGTSTWGNKLFVGGKYYLRSPQRGWAFGGGLTFNSGSDNFKPKLETVYSKNERVTLVLKSQANIFLGIYHYWTLGRNHNRFFLNFGRSVELGDAQFKQIGGHSLTADSRRFVNRLAPGGFMAGLGFSFALYNRHTGM